MQLKQIIKKLLWVFILLIGFSFFPAFMNNFNYRSYQYVFSDQHDHTQVQVARLEKLAKSCRQRNKGSITKVDPVYVVDDYERIAYCAVAKIATTSWNLLYRLIVEEKLEMRQLWWASTMQKLLPDKIPTYNHWSNMYTAGIRKSVIPLNLPMEVPLPNLRSYFKFLAVRHPLDRLASAYKDKVETLYKSPIANQVKDVVYKDGAGRDENKNVSFPQFVWHLFHADSDDQHWQPYTEVCQPCKIKYDFIAKVETLADDLEILLPKMKASQFVGHFSKRPMMTYGYMYQNVSKSLLEAVKVKYKADAELFGYDMNKYDNMVNNNL